MSIDLDAKLVESAYKVSVGPNEYGDVVYQTAGSAVPCLYRDISTFQKNQNRTEVQLDGLLWFGASAAVARGDVFYHADEGYLRIERVIKAKTLLTTNTRQFIKCEVTKQRQVS